MTDAVVAIIVVAAGSGARLGHPIPKAFVEIAGRTILGRSLEPIFRLAEPIQIILVVPADWQQEASVIAEEIAGSAVGYVRIVVGGATRQGSVAAGLLALDPSIETVLVHDAARALTPTTVFERIISSVRSDAHGVVPTLPVSDTIKRVDGPLVVATVDRSKLVAVQTPQGFPRAELEAAYAAATTDFTDDAALFAAVGHPVTTIEGDVLAFKITTEWDLRRAEDPLAGSTRGTVRTGVGFDVHAFDETSPLWLGGVFWPGEKGLSGHSDGDAVAHAVCDALLSAAGLGDVGSNFGTSDARFADAHGDVFLTATVTLLATAGFTIGNVAVQVIGNHPKIGPRRDEIQILLRALVGAPVSVAATTSDALGFTGRGEGIAVIATCLIRSEEN